MKEKLKKSQIRLIVLLIIVAVIVFLSLIAEYIVPNDPNITNIKTTKLAPDSQFWFGTDAMGRCVFSRTMVGAKTSIFASFALVIVTFVFGTTIGVLAGYYGGKVDTLLMRIVDILLAFPGLVLAIAVAGILGGGLINAMLALGLTAWTQYARLARSQVLALKEKVFIQAAKLSGNSNYKIMTRHLLPNILGPLVVNATLQISTMMMGIAGLSFLGLGVQPPAAEWGSMINEGRSLLQLAPWIIMFPGLVMIITIMVFNLLGDTVRDVMDMKGDVE
ncbi:MAG: nickel transporter permease [Clostridiaceae bacterium]